MGNKTLGMSGFDTMSSETDLGPNLSPKTNLWGKDCSRQYKETTFHTINQWDLDRKRESKEDVLLKIATDVPVLDDLMRELYY